LQRQADPLHLQSIATKNDHTPGVGFQQSSGEDTTPDLAVAASDKPPRFRFPLPFDPVRMLAGVLARWPWIAIGMVVAGALGTLFGMHITHHSYSLTVSLIKRRVPQTVQTSESGHAYRPVDLNDATLLATLLATAPLDMALKRCAQNGVDPNRINTLVEAKQLTGTDIFHITYNSPVSPEDAVAFTAIWAEEINAYTQRLQQTEAREVLFILQKEVTEREQQLDIINQAILDFSKANDYLGGEAQVAAVLAKLSQLEIQLETTRATAASKEEQLKHCTEQIHRQSPIESQLKTAKDELANLRSTYTDANPLVQAKQQSIDYLNEQIEASAAKGQLELNSYTGTALGNQLYISILNLRNELLEASNQVRSLEKLYQATAKRLAGFPAIISAYDALKRKNTTITEELTLMNNRLKEAEIFASSAPGYWQVFQAPDVRRIIPSSLVKKPAILGAVCGILGGGLATLLTLLLTHRTTRRSVLECCVATRAPLAACIPTTSDENARAAIHHYWITQLAPRLNTPSSILWWTPALDPGDERRFWTMLASAARDDTGKPIHIHDLTPDALWDDVACPDYVKWHAGPPPTANASSPALISNGATLFRASSLPHCETRESLMKIDCWMTVLSGNVDSLHRTDQYLPVCTTYLPPCGGTIVLTSPPAGRIRAAADVISLYLAQRFS
jgi:uncharacterized protein involved in exopolysaccharide biosynthesis